MNGLGSVVSERVAGQESTQPQLPQEPSVFRKHGAGAPATTRLADALTAIGLSNLILSHNTASITAGSNVYFLRDSQRDLLIGWFILLALFSALSYGLIRLYRVRPSVRKPLAAFAVFAALLALLNFERSLGLGGLPLALAFAGGAVLSGAFWFEARRRGKTRVAIRQLSRISAVFAGVCAFSALWAFAHPYHAPNYDEATLPSAKAPIVWIVFDELDQGWLFDHRPAGLSLPEFDRFRSGATYFSDAARPGPETLYSLPALIEGRTTLVARTVSPTQLAVKFAGSDGALWSAKDSVFASMKAMGRQSSLIGFYHNYGAIFAGAASHIRSEGLVAYGIPAAVENQFMMLIPGNVRVPLEETLGDHDLWNVAMVAQGKIRLDHQLRDTRRAIEQWRSGFIFLHICLPHAPWTQGHFDTSNTGYLSNLTLTDAFLREVRLSLEKTGQWNDATVLVTADHNFRQTMFGQPLNRKVPLMIKLPSEKTELEVDKPVQAVNVRWLLEAVARGKVKTAADAKKFMLSLPMSAAADPAESSFGE